ncbi:MAG: hypothetical protein M9934_03750 [Thermomicrobiales bacterium]|nr:hypothetical protein [Thermomicrobiales bacterium]
MKYQSRPDKYVTSRAHIVLVAMCLAFVGAFASGAEAGPNQAGLLVDYGNGTISWIWVPFAEDEITVAAMLEQSDLELITIGFGGLGTGVCQIEYSGCGPAECRQRMCQTKSSDPFWRVMWLDGDTWRMAGSGVDGTKVSDGEIVALSWSSETPQLPVVSVADVAANAEVDPMSLPDHTVTRTIGDLPNAPEESYGWIPIAGSVGVVLVVAGGLIVRARRPHREAA